MPISQNKKDSMKIILLISDNVAFQIWSLFDESRHAVADYTRIYTLK